MPSDDVMLCSGMVCMYVEYINKYRQQSVQQQLPRGREVILDCNHRAVCSRCLDQARVLMGSCSPEKSEVGEHQHINEDFQKWHPNSWTVNRKSD